MKILLHPVIYPIIRREVGAIFAVVVLSLIMTVIDAVTISILPAILNLIQNLDTATLPKVLQIWMEILAFLPRNDQIVVLLFIIVVGIILKNALYAVTLYVGYGSNSRLSQGFRQEVMESMTKRNQQYFSNTNPGTVIENIVAQPEQLGALGRAITELIVNITSLMVYALLLFVLSIEMAIMTVIFGFVAVGVISFYNRWTSHVTRLATRSRYDLSKIVVEMVNGILTIRAFNKSEEILQRVIALSEKERRNWQLRFLMMMMSAPMTEIIGTIFIGFIIIWSTSRASATDGATLGVLVAFIVVLVRMLIPLKEVNRARTTAASYWTVVDQVLEAAAIDQLDYIEQGGDTVITQFASKIEFKNVSFSYFENPEPTLKHINLNVPRGQLTTVIGQSGSGKSTLINLLLNLYQPQSGDILLDNLPIQDYTLESLREHIAYVQQKPFLFDDTVFNNIAFGAKQGYTPTQADVEAVARLAKAHDFISDLPDGYATIIGDQGTNLSGGQQQRIAIARAFIRDADIIILDEATSALDQLTEKQLFANIGVWGKNKTVFMITHRIELAHLADWLVVFHDGEIVKQGSPDSLRDINGQFTWLYEYVPENAENPV